MDAGLGISNNSGLYFTLNNSSTMLLPHQNTASSFQHLATANSNSQLNLSVNNGSIPLKYLNRRAIKRDSSGENLRKHGINHSCSHPLIRNQEKSEGSIYNEIPSYARSESFIAPDLSKERLAQLIQQQLGPHYILVSLQDVHPLLSPSNLSGKSLEEECCLARSMLTFCATGQAKDLFSQAKRELNKDVRLGLQEQDLAKKVNELAQQIIDQYREQIQVLEQQISDLIQERDNLKFRCQSQMNESIRFQCFGMERETDNSLTETQPLDYSKEDIETNFVSHIQGQQRTQPRQIKRQSQVRQQMPVKILEASNEGKGLERREPERFSIPESELIKTLTSAFSQDTLIFDESVTMEEKLPESFKAFAHHKFLEHQQEEHQPMKSAKSPRLANAGTPYVESVDYSMNTESNQSKGKMSAYESKPISKQEKELQLISRNRDALEMQKKARFSAFNQNCSNEEVDDSQCWGEEDDLRCHPGKNPPKECRALILDWAVREELPSHSKKGVPKLIFNTSQEEKEDKKKKRMTMENTGYRNETGLKKFLSFQNEKEEKSSEEKKVSVLAQQTTSYLDDEADSSMELSVLGEESPAAEFLSSSKKVKQRGAISQLKKFGQNNLSKYLKQ